MVYVSGFLADAGHIFEVATAAAGEPASDLAIVVQADGALHLMDATGWQLAALAAHTGAQTVYRVSRSAGRVRVEGRCGPRSCTLETDTPARQAAALLAARHAPPLIRPLQISG
jgi:hypothetical protein